MKVQGTGMLLVRKPVVRVESAGAVGLRDGSTGLMVVPRIWAVGEAVTPAEVRPLELVSAAPDAQVRPRPELAFYRKYTEAMLRRYVRMSMACGRVPSLLGRELFRGKVTSYQMHGFDDVVIFCMDVEKCLGKLQRDELELVKRVGVQEYTLDDAAGIFSMSVRGVTLRYRRAINRLTGIFLAAGMMEAMKGVVRGSVSAQSGSESVGNVVKGSEGARGAEVADLEGEES